MLLHIVYYGTEAIKGGTMVGNDEKVFHYASLYNKYNLKFDCFLCRFQAYIIWYMYIP